MRAIRGPATPGRLADAVRGYAAVPEHVLVAGRGELLVDVEGVLPRLLEDIANETTLIQVAEYFLTPTREGLKVLEALRARARPTNGRPPIEVNVIVDRQGSRLLPFSSAERFYQQLERDGIRVIRHQSSFNIAKPPIEHRKLIAFGDDVAYVGGMGFGSSEGWNDVMVRLSGQQIAAQAHADFIGRWVDVGGTVSVAQRQLLEAADRAGQTPVDVGYRLIANDGPVRDTTRAIYAIAEIAQRRLWMQTPYFGSPVLAGLSRSALDRGVDTRLWVNGSKGSAFPGLPMLSKTYYTELGAGAREGVRVLEQARMSHLKIIANETWASLGSTNLTYRALVTDHELNLISNDPALLRAIHTMKAAHEAAAHRVTAADMQRPFMRLVNWEPVRNPVRRTIESIT